MRAALSLLLGLFLAVSNASAPAQTHPAPEAPATGPLRTVRVFDFEERDLGNVEDTPIGWVKVEGSGMPHYLRGSFDFAVAHSGQTSFRMDLNGGSIAFRYPENRIFVAEGALYRVEAMVRATEMANARARLSAYFCDEDGRPIAATIQGVNLDPLTAEDGGFHPIALDMVAGPKAVSLVVEMGLLQPRFGGDTELGDHQLAVEDIRGSAWFDDVKVTQVPDIEVYTDRVTNVFYRDERVNVRLKLHDRLTSDLTAELRLFDVDGNALFQRTGGVSFKPTTSSNELLGTIELPPLDPGWYRAQLTIRSGETPISKRSLRFTQLGDPAGRPLPDERFGVIATDLPTQAWQILPQAMDQLAAGRLKLSAWTDAYAIDSDKSAEFDALVGKLRGRGIGFTACLASIPPDIAQRIGGRRWQDLLRIPLERWQPQLAYLVSSHANHLSQWQLLDDTHAEEMARERSLRNVHELLLGQFEQLIDDPDLAMPWPAWMELDARLPSSVALSVGSEILPEQLPLYVADVRAHRGKRVNLVLRPIDRSTYGRAAQERDWALRIAFAFAGGADRIDLPLLLDATIQRGKAMGEPDPLFAIQRTLITQLSGAICLGKVPIADDVDAILFKRDGQGVMIAWKRGDVKDQTQRKVSIALGRAPMRVELSGQATPIRRAKNDASRGDDFELVVGTRPVIVTDIEPALLMLRAAVAIDNPLLESTVRSQGRTLIIRNTFDAPMSGTVRLSGPPGWKLPVRNSTFSLAPGETYREPVTIEFPLNSTAGPKTLTANLTIEGRHDYRVDVPIGVIVGLSDVGLQTIAMRIGENLFVQQLITNYGTEKVDYNAFASLPGQPRQERLVTNLLPGMTVIKKYRFAAPAIDATKVRSGIRELEGRRMLNDEVPIQ